MPPSPQWIAMPTKSVCASCRAAVPAAAAFEADASHHSGWVESGQDAAAPNTLVMSPFEPVPVFSRTTFASATAPKSQPARVYGTQGAGVFLGMPLSGSTVTMFVSGSAGGFPVSSTRSVQYLNEDDDAVDPSALKYRYEFETACPWRSEYTPVRSVRIPFAVCEMRTVWLLVRSVPLLRIKLSKFGICSRSDGTFGLSRRKCTLSKMR